MAVPGGHRAAVGAPPLPGAVGLSHLRVYTSAAADGLAGGTPHLHTACSEAYVVVGGEGRVLTVDALGVRSTALSPGVVAWFTPGTVHRLVNDSGDLEILVVMQNAGLPEAGDMVITFADEVLADRVAYDRAAILPAASTTTAGGDGPVRERRDRAVEGWEALVGGGPEALAALHARAAALVRSRVGGWRARWEEGPRAAVLGTGRQLDLLAAGRFDHLAEAVTHSVPAPPDERRHGCCGTLGVVAWG